MSVSTAKFTPLHRYRENTTHLYNIYTMLDQRRRPTLYKCYTNVLSLLAKRDLISCISLTNRCYWERNWYLKMKIHKFLVSNQTIMSNFHPLEVVGRGSET